MYGLGFLLHLAASFRKASTSVQNTCDSICQKAAIEK